MNDWDTVPLEGLTRRDVGDCVILAAWGKDCTNVNALVERVLSHIQRRMIEKEEVKRKVAKAR